MPSIPARVEVITEEEEEEEGEESEEDREEVRPGPRCKEVDEEEGSGSESPGKSTCILIERGWVQVKRWKERERREELLDHSLITLRLLDHSKPPLKQHHEPLEL